VNDHPELAEYLLDQRPPLEAQLIDLTDEIAYNTADLDDGFEAHLLTLQEIRKEVEIFERNFFIVDRKYPTATDKLKFNEALKGMLNALVTDLIETTRLRVQHSGVRNLEDLRNFPERLAAFSTVVDAERAQAKRFLYRALYYSEHLKGQKADGEKIVGDLFDHFMRNADSLPAAYRRQIESQQENAARVVCDYIAGMTDNFILEQHQRIIQGIVTR
jgi:dGTPase